MAVVGVVKKCIARMAVSREYIPTRKKYDAPASNRNYLNAHARICDGPGVFWRGAHSLLA